MRTWGKEELESDKEYFKLKRDRALENFNKAIRDNKSFESIQTKYDILMRSHKQWVLIDDALLVHEFIHKREIN
jgi:hypothetical protein|tara:strand:+ start:6110 stop:6331 length:222 start_codon:yes stop_codon:yes gene_type:complete